MKGVIHFDTCPNPNSFAFDKKISVVGNDMKCCCASNARNIAIITNRTKRSVRDFVVLIRSRAIGGYKSIQEIKASKQRQAYHRLISTWFFQRKYWES